jgi:PPE-repeat protein
MDFGALPPEINSGRMYSGPGSAPLLAAAAQAAGDAASAMAGPVAGALDGSLGSLGALGNSVSASMGNGALIGPLSVPPSWTAAAPVHSPLASALGGTPMTAPPAAATGMPGMPLGNFVGQASGRAVPQYGFRPTFVVRPPSAG